MIDIIYQSFLSAPVALGAAELATLKGLVLAVMPRLTSVLKPPLKTTKLWLWPAREGHVA